MTEAIDSKILELLVLEAQKGSQDAWEKLVEAHYGLIFTIAYSRLSNSESAEDLVQEVFLRAWLQLKQLRKLASFPFWIGRMARHLGTSWVRNHQRRSDLLKLVEAKESEMERVQDTAPAPDQVALDKERQELLHNAIQTLPAQEREATLLHYVEGIPKNKVALHMGIHPATVGRMLDRAAVTLRGNLQEDSFTRLETLELPKRGPEATIACVGVVAAMTPGAREAIIAAASKGLPALVSTHTSSSAGTISLGFLSFLWQSLQSTFQGVLYMGSYKTMAAVGVCVAAATIGGVAMNSSSEEGSQPTNNSASEQAQSGSTLNESTWQGSNLFQQVGTEWKYVQINEVNQNDNWIVANHVEGQCKVIGVPDQSTSIIELEIQHFESIDTTVTGADDIIGRKFHITINTESNKLEFRDGDNKGIDPYQSLPVMMNLSGANLGPLSISNPMAPGDSESGEFSITTQALSSSGVNGTERFALRELNANQAVFDVESTATMINFPIGRDERTRTIVMMKQHETQNKGTWTFDMKNPLNSVMQVESLTTLMEINMVISVPGREEPVVQPLPTPPNQQSRTTITFSEV